MKHVILWLKRRLRRREIYLWLQHNDGEAIAAQSLWHLNRYARSTRSAERHEIYRLKKALIEHWYASGHVSEVTLQRQDMECWSCNGTGEWFGADSCYKCAGTGIYRTHWLYRFVIPLGNRVYVWHQPKSIVDFKPRLTWIPVSQYVNRGAGQDGRLDFGRRRFLLLVLDVYLEMVTGTNYRLEPRLVDALRHDWIHFVWRYDLDFKAQRLTRPWRRIRRMASIVGSLYMHGELPESQREMDPERDIPF